jgi:hypothetical protein
VPVNHSLGPAALSMLFLVICIPVSSWFRLPLSE